MNAFEHPAPPDTRTYRLFVIPIDAKSVLTTRKEGDADQTYDAAYVLHGEYSSLDAALADMVKLETERKKTVRNMCINVYEGDLFLLWVFSSTGDAKP